MSDGRDEPEGDKDPDDILDEAIHEGPGYPDEVEQAWENDDPMEGEAPTA